MLMAIEWKRTRIWRRDPESNRDTRICNPLHSHSAIPPYPGFHARVVHPLKRKNSASAELSGKLGFGAGNEIRTRDPNLGKVVLYQLSYSRVLGADGYSSRERGAVKAYLTLRPLAQRNMPNALIATSGSCPEPHRCNSASIPASSLQQSPTKRCQSGKSADR